VGTDVFPFFPGSPQFAWASLASFGGFWNFFCILTPAIPVR